MSTPVIPDTSGYDNGGATFQPCGPTSSVVSFADSAGARAWLDIAFYLSVGFLVVVMVAVIVAVIIRFTDW